MVAKIKKKNLIKKDKNIISKNLICRTIATTYSDNLQDKKAINKELDRIENLIASLQPRNEIEAMLVSQIIATYHASTECFMRTNNPEQTFEGRKLNLKYANSLTATYIKLVESLNKMQGKNISEQKVTVQHVNVNSGGQAIVGNIKGGKKNVE